LTPKAVAKAELKLFRLLYKTVSSVISIKKHFGTTLKLDNFKLKVTATATFTHHGSITQPI